MLPLFRSNKTKESKEHLIDALGFLNTNKVDPVWTHLSHEEMKSLVSEAISKLEGECLDKELSDKIWKLFAPTCDWDDIGGNSKLGNSIFSSVNKLYGKPDE